MYQFSIDEGALGGKLCGAGGGGAFLFFSNNPEHLKKSIKGKFTNCFEIDFDFERSSIKELNHL